MIGRIYTATIGSSSHSTAATLIEIAAASDMVVFVERMWIDNVAQDTSEMIGVKVEDITTTGTGAANTPKLHQDGDSAASATVKNGMTAQPTYSGLVYIEKAFNVLSGFLWVPASDDDVLVISPSQLLGMAMDTAPDAAVTLSYGMTFREIGG